MNDQAPFSWRADDYVTRVEQMLRNQLKAVENPDSQLCQALHYAVFNGGKRLRPLLVYATGEVLGIERDKLDAPACAVELIHCYSLVHDDLPAMDDDDLRRGRPTLHLAFDEAIAILAGDALQALAFEILGSWPTLAAQPGAAARMVADLSRACGADGMAGGQALDLAFEGQQPTRSALEDMYARKTGALIRAAVLMPCELADRQTAETREALSKFAECIGLAFQIRDDVLDIEGETRLIGKPQGADQARNKATWPSLFGLEAARARIDQLAGEARLCLAQVEGNTGPLAWLAERMVDREF